MARGGSGQRESAYFSLIGHVEYGQELEKVGCCEKLLCRRSVQYMHANVMWDEASKTRARGYFRQNIGRHRWRVDGTHFDALPLRSSLSAILNSLRAKFSMYALPASSEATASLCCTRIVFVYESGRRPAERQGVSFGSGEILGEGGGEKLARSRNHRKHEAGEKERTFSRSSRTANRNGRVSLPPFAATPCFAAK